MAFSLGEQMRELFQTWGGRAILGSLCFLSLSLVYFATALILEKREDFSPLRNPSPQQIIGPVIVTQGGLLVTEGTKCNDADKSVSFDSQRYFQNLDDRRIRVLMDEPRFGVIREPGCVTRQYETTIPKDLPLGTYRIEGQEITRSDHDETQVASYYSERFEVIAEAVE